MQTAPQQNDKVAIRRALISVSDKTGILEFAQRLNKLNVDILSTGGTAKLLIENNIPVTEIADYTGFPEIMGGRVKTLHPKVHAGVLARRGVDEATLEGLQIPAIDMVVVNLYPFEQTIAKAHCTLNDAIENIDIGGPTMVRAAAKNYDGVAIVVNSTDYLSVLDELENNDGQLTRKTRFELAKKAFIHTSHYDSAICNYLTALDDDGDRAAFPETFNVQLQKKQSLRYGENPHQSAAFYTLSQQSEPAVANAEQLQGKALSYNNIADTDAALECVKNFTDAPACTIVKHANPCGVAVSDSLFNAYDRAYQTDPTSAFGGIIAFNQPLDAKTAQAIIDRQFVEVIIAPGIEEQAKTILSAKANVRVLVTKPWSTPLSGSGLTLSSVNGGMLIQDRDRVGITLDDLKTVSKRQPSAQELQDLLFSWRVAKHVKSNAIVYAKDNATIGVGAGQMSRVYSARIAVIKAQDAALSVKGSVMASDAFFPFRDGLDAAAKEGVTAVIQPGGSIRDDEVIAAADEHGMAMVFTGMRHFWH